MQPRRVRHNRCAPDCRRTRVDARPRGRVARPFDRKFQPIRVLFATEGSCDRLQQDPCSAISARCPREDSTSAHSRRSGLALARQAWHPGRSAPHRDVATLQATPLAAFLTVALRSPLPALHHDDRLSPSQSTRAPPASSKRTAGIVLCFLRRALDIARAEFAPAGSGSKSSRSTDHAATSRPGDCRRGRRRGSGDEHR